MINTGEYPMTLAANSTRVQPAHGTSIRFAALTGAESLRIQLPDLGVDVKLRRAQRLHSDVPFSRVIVLNESGNTVHATLYIGSVVLIDEQASRSAQETVRQNQLFSKSVNVAPSVGNFSHGQLWNPVGSGIVVYARRISANLDTAGQVQVRSTTAALTLAGFGENLNFGAAVSQAEVRSDPVASLQGTGVIQLLTPAANENTEMLRDSDVIRMEEGNGLLLVPTTANVRCRGNFTWTEELV